MAEIGQLDPTVPSLLRAALAGGDADDTQTVANPVDQPSMAKAAVEPVPRPTTMPSSTIATAAIAASRLRASRSSVMPAPLSRSATNCRHASSQIPPAADHVCAARRFRRSVSWQSRMSPMGTTGCRRRSERGTVPHHGCRHRPRHNQLLTRRGISSPVGCNMVLRPARRLRMLRMNRLR